MLNVNIQSSRVCALDLPCAAYTVYGHAGAVPRCSFLPFGAADPARNLALHKTRLGLHPADSPFLLQVSSASPWWPHGLVPANGR